MQHDNMIQCAFYLDRQHKRVLSKVLPIANQIGPLVYAQILSFLMAKCEWPYGPSCHKLCGNLPLLSQRPAMHRESPLFIQFIN